MLDKSIQINCADCKSKKCLSFNSLELACPDYIDSFPASSIKDVCLTGALKFNKDYIFIDKGRCINWTPLKNPTTPEFTDLTKKRKILGEVHLCLIDRTN